MSNEARNWTIGAVVFAVVTGLATSLLYDWLKAAAPGVAPPDGAAKAAAPAAKKIGDRKSNLED